MTQPRSAAAPRPDNRPFYIAPSCPACGTPLVLLDHVEHPTAPESEIWFDEWICPHCREGVFMDWPASEWDVIEEAKGAIARGDVVRDEDLKHELGL